MDNCRIREQRNGQQEPSGAKSWGQAEEESEQQRKAGGDDAQKYASMAVMEKVAMMQCAGAGLASI